MSDGTLRNRGAPRAVLAAALPEDATLDERIYRAVSAGSLAPSIHNTQPWFFNVRARPDAIEIWTDQSRLLSVADPSGRQLMISCGAAAFNVYVELVAQGFDVSLERFPAPNEPQHVATIWLHGGKVEGPIGSLAAAIPTRYTARSAFRAQPVGPSLTSQLVHAASCEGIEAFILEPEQVADVGRRTRHAHRLQQINPALLQELLRWTRPENSEATDGVVFSAVGRDSVVNVTDPLPQRDFALGRKVQGQDAYLRERDPTLLVLASPHDEPIDWLQTGAALQRVLLLAAEQGVMASYLNQSIELPALRPRLKTDLALCAEPQMILRLGYPYPERQPVSPRRPVYTVLRQIRS